MKRIFACLTMACVAGAGASAAAREVPESPPPLFSTENAQADPANARMQAMFKAAFPLGAHKAIDGKDHDFMPFAVVDIGPDLAALVSAGWPAKPECPAGTVCIDASGSFAANALHYVRRDAGGYRVIGEWINFGGKGVGEWAWTDKVSASPVFYNSFNAGTGRDCTASRAVLVEFAPQGPVELAAFPVFYQYNDGRTYVGPFHGAITQAENGQSFTVTYSHTRTDGPFADIRYLRGPNEYKVDPGAKWRMPVCAGERS